MEEVISMRSKRVSFDYDIPITPDPSDNSGDEESDSSPELSDSDSSHEEYQPSSSRKIKKSISKKQRQQRSPIRAKR